MTSPHLYALLVGINQYEHKQVKNLNGCVNDIRSVQEFLNQRLHQKPDILLLEDQAATRNAIIDGFKNHLSQAGKGDVVLFYFCGHGARESAGEEFKDWQLDNVHETIVCHDSRSEIDGRRVPDLADKELRYLIAQVANKGENSPEHVLVVFDCCHSSSGTRDLEDTDGIRQVDDVAPARQYSDFCFASDITTDRLSSETLPQGSHTFIAACLKTETAKETSQRISQAASQVRGLFTYSLIKELESQNATLSYERLIHQVRTRVTGVRLYQTPQLEFVEGLDCKKSGKPPQAFLGSPAIIKPRDPCFTLSYRSYAQATKSGDPEQRAEWIINAGAFQELQKDMELAVYPEGSQYEEFEIRVEKEIIKAGSQTAIRNIRITEIRANESVVEFLAEPLTPDSSQQFPAIVSKRPVPKILFYFEGEKDADQKLLEKVRKKLEEWHSLSVGVISDRKQAHQYRLYVRHQQFEIRDGIDDRLLIERFAAEDNDSSIDLAASRVEHIARWITTRDLENPNSSINKDGIEIEVTYQGVTSKEPHLVLCYESKRPRIQVTIRNRSGYSLFFTLLDICSDYSITDPKLLFDGENQETWLKIENGDTYIAKYKPKQGELSQDIPIGIPQKYEKLTEYGETLKLIASTHQFPVDQFKLNALPVHPFSGNRTIGDDDADQPLPVGDWVTQQFSFTFIRPESSVKVSSNTQTELSKGISIQLPDGFSATASLKSASTVSGERGLGSDIRLPLLKDSEAFDLIDRRRGDRGISQIPNQQLSVLKLSGSSLAIDQVTPDSPIVISSDRCLAPNEGILALAHDGNFWLPVGYAMPQENGKTEIEVQHLVTQENQVTQEGEREISEAISLCFLKVALQRKQTAWLRKAIPNSDGTVSFTPKGDLESVKQAVSQAEHIVLFIHGILGDTESMVPSVLTAKLLNSNSQQELGKYDLILAFDYESLNTKIQETANRLKQQLQQVGLAEGHKKTLHIIAHSMGGLVSRSFIEQQGGNNVVNHLMMLGTPNGGSEWSSVYQLATLLLSVGLSFIPNSFAAGALVSLLPSKTIGTMSNTLKQMNVQQSDLLPELRRSQDPRCPYTIIAGDTQSNQELKAKANSLLKALEQKVWKGLEFPFKGQRNDIAVTVESIFTRKVFEGRRPAVKFIDPVGCNHLVYFQDRRGLEALTEAVRQAFELPAQSENQSVARDLTEPDALPIRNSVVASSASTQLPSQQQGIPTPPKASPVSLNSKPPTRTTSWFDTTHLIAIGIDDYKNGVPPLEKAVNDAFAVAQIIKDLNPTEKVKYYFSVAPRSTDASEIEQKVKELDGETFPSTNKGFDELLSHLKKTVGTNDRIILYFAGHGIALPFARVLKERGKGGQLQVKDDKPQGYLLFQDAKKRERDTYIKMDELTQSLEKIDCRHSLIILDCCFAGAVEWSLRRERTDRQIGDEEVTPTILDRYTKKKAWQILTSSSENQKANEVLTLEEQLEKNDRGSGKNSPFVISLKEALVEGKADYPQPPDGKKRGFIHTTRLIDYLREEIESKSSEANKLQTPCLFTFPFKHEQTAEFVFLLSGKNLDDIKKNLPADPKIEEIKNPYLGLESYSPNDSDLFFGRERLIQQLENLVNFGLGDSTPEPEKSRQESLIQQLKNLGQPEPEGFGRERLIQQLKNLVEGKAEDLIQQLMDFGRADPKKLLEQYDNKFPLTVVLGASGSGKSSLVKAGLIPKLFPKQPENSQQLHRGWVEFRPGRSPRARLKQALKELQIGSILQREKRLLVIDQFEEVETQCEDRKEKTIFWEELIKLLEGKKVDVVLSLRSDFETTLRGQFESALSKFSKFNKDASNDWVSARFLVPAMEPEELEKVIAAPAAKHAVFFEASPPDRRDKRTLVKQLSHEVAGMPGALPLLSVALKSMYENFKKRYVEGSQEGKPPEREITWEDYKSLGEGGVSGAIRKKATEIYSNLSSNDERRMLRWVMMRMITRKGNQPLVRKPVLKADLEYPKKQQTIDCEKVIQLFLNERLLVAGRQGDEVYYEPAHDALVREWDYISAWLEGKEHPDHTSSESMPEPQPEAVHEDVNLTQNSQPKSGAGNFLSRLKNPFLRRDNKAAMGLQPFNLTLLEELNAAAKKRKKSIF